MGQKSLGKIKRVLANEAGQMSVFVALIFQVLFVFFAMVINIGLLVHDKINLQNAVDLGAYYAAQRQAEILNQIAHINYQIRQDYKLLVWRYRVLGTLGRGVSPAITPANHSLPDDIRFAPQDPYEEVPAICVANDQWFEYAKDSRDDENICHRQLFTRFPKVPQMPVIAPWVPGIYNARAAGIQALRAQNFAFANAGPLNWGITMYFLWAYKQSIALRKQEIWKLRQQLVEAQMTDLSLQPVRVGVEKTIKHNLTSANHNELEIDVVNGLANSVCAMGAMPGDRAIPEILTAPILVYLQVNGGAVDWALHKNPPNNIGYVDPTGFFSGMVNEPAPSHPMHSSLGFEKNPWCMAYVGVKAKSRPHKPFAPFGKPIEIRARAFAQPFGGRIGPWYNSRWPQQALRSGPGQRVDPLTNPRVEPGSMPSYNAGDGITNDAFPNYSRYPGDPLGLRSQRAQGAQRMIFAELRGAMPKERRLQVAYYTHFDQLGQTGDALAWSPSDPPQGPPNDTVQKLRMAEAAAVAPDLFDLTYYSIEPKYNKAYFQNGGANATFSSAPPMMINGVPARPASDLGSRNGAGEGLQVFDIVSQINVATSPGAVSDANLNPNLFWLVRSWHHLLTGWAPQSSTKFGFPAQTFGRCFSEASETTALIPGGCAAGGRTGYSVRLISREHLLGSDWKIGGDGEAPGKILNPPSTSF